MTCQTAPVSASLQEAEKELELLKFYDENPFGLLIYKAKLLYELEMKTLEVGKGKGALVLLRNQKHKEIEILDMKIEAQEK